MCLFSNEITHTVSSPLNNGQPRYTKGEVHHMNISQQYTKFHQNPLKFCEIIEVHHNNISQQHTKFHQNPLKFCEIIGTDVLLSLIAVSLNQGQGQRN